MTKSNKIRKNVNVSIQSKKYNEAINSVLNDWEEEGLNISTEVCNSILLANKIAKSPTLLNVMNIYDLAEKILNLYQIDEVENSLEEVLSKLINVNGSELTDVISGIFNDTSKTNQKSSKKQSKKQDKDDDLDKKSATNQNKVKSQPDTIAISSDEDTEDEDTDFEYNDSDYEIPEDILFNS